MRISVKDHQDVFDFAKLHLKLKEVLFFAVDAAGDLGFQLEVTSICRDDGGVHATDPVRGIDVVPTDRAVYKMDQLRTAVNETWNYGKGDFEVCPEVRHGTAPHCHLQVRDQTTKKKGREDEETMVDE